MSIPLSHKDRERLREKNRRKRRTNPTPFFPQEEVIQEERPPGPPDWAFFLHMLHEAQRRAQKGTT